MKIILYEYASGGGYAGQQLSAGILAEGFGMLRSVASDFKASGHEVTTLLDARISKLDPPIDSDRILSVGHPEESKKLLVDLAKINDWIYVIAPETGHILETIVGLAERTGKPTLNCNSTAIAKVADKALLYRNLGENGFPIPKTLVLSTADTNAQTKQTVKQQLNYPLVFKPVDGVGCSGLSVVKDEVGIEKAIAKIKDESKDSRYIAQEFVEGISASVSLLATEDRALAISLNRQNVIVSGPESLSNYSGGCIPLEHPFREEAFNLAEKVVESFRGLQGYVGVDFVLAPDGAYVVDVNPRLTTSYVALRKVVKFNLAKAIEDAVLKRSLPIKPESCYGFACFQKSETAKPSRETYKNAAAMASVVSPPFPLEDNPRSCALLVGNAANLDEATFAIEEAKKRLSNIIG